MFWKPHKKLSAEFEGNKAVRTNGKPFCLASWNGASVRSSLCSWKFLRSGPQFTLLEKMVFTLWEKALKEKSNIMSG